MRNPVNKKTMKFLHQSPPRNPLKIGLIGCGRLGRQIISTLLTYGDVRTEEITISTRRPHILSEFIQHLLHQTTYWLPIFVSSFTKGGDFQFFENFMFVFEDW